MLVRAAGESRPEMSKAKSMCDERARIVIELKGALGIGCPGRASKSWVATQADIRFALGGFVRQRHDKQTTSSAMLSDPNAVPAPEPMTIGTHFWRRAPRISLRLDAFPGSVPVQTGFFCESFSNPPSARNEGGRP